MNNNSTNTSQAADSDTIYVFSGKAVKKAPGGKPPKNCLSREELQTLHLIPTADPVCYIKDEQGEVRFFFNPDNVKVAPAEIWYSADFDEDNSTRIHNGIHVPRIDKDGAELLGYLNDTQLAERHLSRVEAPCAFVLAPDEESGEVEAVFYYDVHTCLRQPLSCVRCGKGDRFRNKLCRKCYEKDMLKRRREGDAHRASQVGYDRAKVIFFDLELTGVYPYDEIISVSITDGWGNELMDTLVRPEHRKNWKTTVRIHGITPEMVKHAPLLSELTPRIKAILLGADILVAYGISTDYTHIKKIFTPAEQDLLVQKNRCASKEYVRYISEYEPDINRSSLVSATEYFGIEWSGTAHTSIADTHACRLVWERILPNYYTEPLSQTPPVTELMRSLPDAPSLTFAEGAALARAEKDEQKKASNSQGGKNKSRKNRSSSKAAAPAQKPASAPKKAENTTKPTQNAKSDQRADKTPKQTSSKSKKKKHGFFASFFGKKH